MESVILAFVVLFASMPAIVVTFITILQWRWESQIRLMTVCEGKNDDEFAKKVFQEMLGIAEKRLDIFDDGNVTDDSIYMDKEILHSIEKKLASSPQFRITCLFNMENPITSFEEKFSSHDQVDIYYPLRSEEVEEKRKTGKTEKHYKIVDGGRFVYVSKHGLGEEARDYEFYNFKRVKEEFLNEFVNLRFEKMLNHTKERFGYSKVKQNFSNETELPFYFKWLVSSKRKDGFINEQQAAA